MSFLRIPSQLGVEIKAKSSREQSKASKRRDLLKSRQCNLQMITGCKGRDVAVTALVLPKNFQKKRT